MNASPPPMVFTPIALSGDFIDDQCVRSVANIILAGDGYMFARKRHQLRILRRGGRLIVGEEDGAIVAKDDERRAVFCACFRTRYADGSVDPLGRRMPKQVTPMKVDAKTLRYNRVILLPRKHVLTDGACALLTRTSFETNGTLDKTSG
jgi:hypothetical protein